MEVATLFDQARRAHQAGEVAQAEQLYRALLDIEPGHVPAQYLRGVALHALGRLDEAEIALDAAARHDPGHAEARNHRGVVQVHRGRLDEAIASFRDALRVRADFAEARRDLMLAIERRGEPPAGHGHETPAELVRKGMEAEACGALDDAEAAYREAIRRKPESFAAFCNLGSVLVKRGRRAEAAESCRQALALKPDLAEAWLNLGLAQAGLGALDEAASSCRHALALRPESVEARLNLGLALVEQGRLAEAIARYREGIRLRPDSSALESSLLYALNLDPSVDAKALLDAHRLWAVRHVPERPDGPAPDHDRAPQRRLRVGYVSPDLKVHPVAFFLVHILAQHDRRNVETFCYAEVASPDETTATLRSIAHAWRSTVGLSDAQVADQVRRDRIDILVDLAGHTAGHRLGMFARKPAPVQVTYLGYPNTTGLSTIDYLLTDAVVDPPGRPAWSVETPYRLAGGFCCYCPPANAPDVGPLPAWDRGAMTFGVLHKLSKVNEQVLDLWSDLLLAVPSARLLIFRDTLRGEVCQGIQRHFERRGVESQRIELRHAVERGCSHLEVYRSIDIALDVFPWCGHTTACESLWMGVPVITLAGERHATRMSASVLTEIGLADWIAETSDEYVAVAKRWAADWDRLASLRAGLRDRMRGSSLLDAGTWVRGLEAAYRDMWRTWVEGRR